MEELSELQLTNRLLQNSLPKDTKNKKSNKGAKKGKKPQKKSDSVRKFDKLKDKLSVTETIMKKLHHRNKILEFDNKKMVCVF